MLMQRAVISYLSFWSFCVLRWRKPFIIGVTGSAGKTTTTAMIAAVLARQEARPLIGKVAATQRNMNCDRGLPQTLLRYEKRPRSRTPARLKFYAAMPLRALKLMSFGSYPDVLVLEYAAGGGGTMERLARLAPPDIAVVTTIGPSHLVCMKTVDGVAQQKGLLVRAAPPEGLVILGDNHDHVDRLAAMARAPVVRVPGRGLELAAAIARVVARRLEIPEAAVDAALATFQPPKGRLQTWRLERLTMIDDSFNANPLSMRLGLETLGEMAPAAAGGRRLAILGEMAELGDEAPRFHREIGVVAHRHADLVVGVGELARHYQPDQWFATSEACAEAIGHLVEADDRILVKGSHSAHMAPIVRRLKKIGGAGSGEPPAAALPPAVVQAAAIQAAATLVAGEPQRARAPR